MLFPETFGWNSSTSFQVFNQCNLFSERVSLQHDMRILFTNRLEQFWVCCNGCFLRHLKITINKVPHFLPCFLIKFQILLSCRELLHMVKQNSNLRIPTSELHLRIPASEFRILLLDSSLESRARARLLKKNYSKNHKNPFKMTKRCAKPPLAKRTSPSKPARKAPCQCDDGVRTIQNIYR